MFTIAILYKVLCSENIFHLSDEIYAVGLIDFRVKMGDGQRSAQDGRCGKAKPNSGLMLIFAA